MREVSLPVTNSATKSSVRSFGPARIQQWVKWCSLAGVGVAAAALVWFREEFSNAQLVFSWIALATLLLFLLRAGWVRLFGPVFFYEVVRNARRSRTYSMRCGYLLLLLLFLFIVVAPRVPSPSNNYRRNTRVETRAMAAVAESFFATFMSVQFGLIVLLTPAYVAGAITEEKERKTLEYLLATDLDNREIVLGKLVARVGYLTLLLLTGLPVLSAVQFLGGVEPSLVFAGFAATAMTAASLAGMSILASVYSKRSRDAIIRTYLTIILYFALCYLIAFLADWGGYTTNGRLLDGESILLKIVRSILYGNPVFALISVFRPSANAGPPLQRLPAVLLHYATFHGLVTLSTVSLAVWRLRPVAIREVVVSRAKTKERGAARPVTGPPMVWKETYFGSTSRFGRWGKVLMVVGMILTFLPVPIMWIESSGYSRRSGPYGLSRDFNGYVRVVGTSIACLALLGAAVRGAIAIRSERDKDTLDSLLTTSLTTREILHGKWVGCLRGLRWPAAWLGSIYAIGVMTGGLRLSAVPLLAAAFAVYAGTLAVVGLWFSTVCKTTLRATVASVAAALGLSVGHWLLWACCISFIGVPESGRGTQNLLIMEMGITPPAVLGVVLPSSADEFDVYVGPHDVRDMMGAFVIGTTAWIVLGRVWWAILKKRFLIDTNRCDFTYPEKALRKSPWRSATEEDSP